VQNGTGAWTAVSASGSTNRSYSFTVGATGGVAYAIPRSGGGTDVTVQYGTATELGFSGTGECTTNRARQNLTGTVAGLNTSNPLASQSASITVGSGAGSAAANGPFTVTGAPIGVSDLMAVRSTTSISASGFTQTPDRIILRRNVNYTSTIPAIDFGTEGFAPANATYTVSNLSGEAFVSAITLFSTTNGSSGTFVTQNLTGAAALNVFGVPSANLQAGDQHQVLIGAFNNLSSTNTSSRLVYQYNAQLANRSIALGALPPTITPTSLGSSPYARYSVTAAWPSDYPDAIGIGYSQSASNSNSWTLTLSRGYAGASSSTWTLAIPDFSGVAGFQSSWGLSSALTNWSFTISGIISGFNASTGQFGEGGTWRAASRTGTVTP
jgi:hypothetical protein